MPKTILVIDDEIKIRELFYDLFSMGGYKIITAAGGEEGIALLKKEKVDLVLLDIKMPQLDGITTLKKIREFDTTTKIIMLTALEDPELDRQARLNGATGLMRKSWGAMTVSKIVGSVINERLEVGSQNKKILIADDEDEICLLLSTFLEKKGFNPVTARSGEEALEKIAQERPIIILLDINLPGMDGLMTIKKIKQTNESIGIIVVTGMTDESIALEAMRLGIYDYLIKPVNLDYLLFCLTSNIVLMNA